MDGGRNNANMYNARRTQAPAAGDVEGDAAKSNGGRGVGVDRGECGEGDTVKAQAKEWRRRRGEERTPQPSNSKRDKREFTAGFAW